MAQNEWDWDSWPSVHPVKAAFNSLAGSVRDVKLDGVGCLPTSLRDADANFLNWNSTLLGRYLDDEARSARLDRIARKFRDEPSGRFSETYAYMMGVSTADLTGEWEARKYVVEQVSAMTAGLWKDPVNAFLYTSAQAAAHDVSRRCIGEPEPSVTEHLRLKLEWVLDNGLFQVLKQQHVGLPEGSRLEFGAASMQGHSDYLGSDLALVVGTRVCGRPMYRVVLLQAKWESKQHPGVADVSQNNGGQLDELLSTGMGFYLFYPRITKERSFVMTVRRAEDVYRDVWSWGDRADYGVDVSQARGGGARAWDLPLFLAGALTDSCPDGVGRLFPDVESVCSALLDDRKVPLRSRVIYFDTTGCLKIHSFEGQLRRRGFQPSDTHSAPSGPQAADDDIGPDGP